METVRYVDPAKVKRFVVDLFGKYGVKAEDAAMVADHLIDADLKGINTHGLTRIPLYTEKIDAGICNATGTPEVVRDFGATALIDAKDTLGQVSATMAMNLAIKKASDYGVGFVGVRNGCHYGTAGYYAMMAERLGMIGFSSTNSGVWVSPFGGIEARLGTNPFAVAIPAEKHLPVLLDMATSRVARGKLLVAVKKGVPIPDDWALDPDGNVTTDPARGLAGMLLPLGYKGYGMAVVIDMLTGVLMGSGFGKMVDTATDFPKVGNNFMAINTEVFCELGEFTRNMDAFIDEIKATKLADDAEQILMPGEIEFHKEAENMAGGGVPLQPFQLRELRQQASEHGLCLDDYLE